MWHWESRKREVAMEMYEFADISVVDNHLSCGSWV